LLAHRSDRQLSAWRLITYILVRWSEIREKNTCFPSIDQARIAGTQKVYGFDMAESILCISDSRVRQSRQVREPEGREMQDEDM